MGRAGHGRRLQGLLAGFFRSAGREGRVNIPSVWNAISSVAYKEFLHVWRDRRILALILVLPPFFTLLFGHAFEGTALSNAPALLYDRDQSPESAKLRELLTAKEVFVWKD